MDLIATTNAALTSIAKVLDYFKNNVAGHFTDQSLTSITKLTRAEPLTIISQDCANLEYLPDLLNTVLSIYSGYFLQAVALLTRVNDIEVVRILDRLNPDRDATGFLLSGRASESAGSLMANNYKFALPGTQSRLIGEAVSSDAENAKTIYEAANLAVGKLLSVEIVVTPECGEPKTVRIPVSVRLSPAILNEESLSHIFTHRKSDVGLVERYHSWRAGQITLIKDMVFCQDLINEYRRAALKDTTGTMAEILRRVNNSRTFGLLTKNPSLATASNIYIMSSSTAKAIEAKVGQKFSSTQGREKILENTYAMVIGVVDQDWGQVTFYFNGIAHPSTFNLRSLQSASKNKGPDITDVMRSLLEGKAPTF